MTKDIYQRGEEFADMQQLQTPIRKCWVKYTKRGRYPSGGRGGPTKWVLKLEGDNHVRRVYDYWPAVDTNAPLALWVVPLVIFIKDEPFELTAAQVAQVKACE